MHLLKVAFGFAKLFLRIVSVSFYFFFLISFIKLACAKVPYIFEAPSGSILGGVEPGPLLPRQLEGGMDY